LIDTNNGYKSRKSHIALSRPVEMIDKLKFDLASQNRYILNDTTVNITLTRSSDTFALFYKHSGTASDPVINPKVKFLEASLFVRKHVLYPSIVLAHQRLLESGHSAKYPIKRSEVKFFTIPSGNQSFIEENVFLGGIPSRIVVCLVSSRGFNGDYQVNPYLFTHHNLSYVSVTVNNVSIPIRGMNLDFSDTDSNYLLPYYLLFSSLGIAGQDESLDITRNTFSKNKCFFAFDINQTAFSDSMLQLEKNGSVRIELKFSKAVSEALNCLVYSEHQNVLELNRYRQVNVV